MVGFRVYLFARSLLFLQAEEVLEVVGYLQMFHLDLGVSCINTKYYDLEYTIQNIII
jgi:hypothetical protein